MRYNKPVDLLKLNVALLPLEKKLLNIMFSDFIDEFHSYSPLDYLSSYHFSINLTHYNRLIKNDRKLSASTIARQIKDKNIAVCMTEGTEIQLFTQFDVIDNKLSFTLNTDCNQFFCEGNLFVLAIKEHNLIKKKNTLTLYEICMFALCYPTSCLESRKPFKSIPYKKNERILFTHSFDNLKLMFGKATYKDYFKSEFERSVLRKAMTDLNSYNLGFELTLRNKEKDDLRDAYCFEIEVTDEKKYKLLLNL